MKNIWGQFALGMAVALTLSSCASISVQPGTARVTETKPELIYVADFDTTNADFRVDREGAELADFKQNLQAMMQTGLVTEITDKLGPAVADHKSDHGRHARSWVIRGEFKTVVQGSRLLRSAIGFGAGGTKLETQVEVYELSDLNTPIMTFSTTGGSNAEPGAIASLTTDPLYLAIGGVGGIAHGLSEDTARTSREITAELSDYMFNRGWISEDQRIEPKHANGANPW